ncbi:arsenic resistance N-acetyltransferase ArsN2 [Halobacterium sp. KA-4]|uniref:arsenic resistance N-acetyltransferase ArsN2 n=1 Tax=Halobacterium sp. KA-4 TaxID=2896367 RepID=UPI001E4960A5|nr:arsenic resistance N-acetyltransferase ArsN2 [Halobacterium sp. KA-4]MCD2200783.1 arsenic resistance N-acetyltransferase ArsN2 [Halobacterium sp. KA-4]
MPNSLTVREADAEAMERIAALLAANDLPHRGLDESPGTFVAGYADGVLVAAGGVEPYDADAVLRSVVVAEAHRSAGFGTALYDELERVAAAGSAETVYLLTTTASAFFRERGFETTSRADAPPAVRGSTLFAERCPASATCMQKEIA